MSEAGAGAAGTRNNSFAAGFAARHEGVAQALQQAFAAPLGGFTPADIRDRASPVSFSPQKAGPKHFHPANPNVNPTEGWDPFDGAAPVSAPFIDPVAAAHAAGVAEGTAAALADSAANAARDRTLLDGLSAALRADERIDRARMALQLRQTVLFLVRRLIGEAGVSPDLLGRRIDSAAAMIADSAESAILRVHPDDVALLDGRLPGTIFAVGDVGVARGGFVLEAASTIVEDGPDLWLDQLAQAIDRVAVPPS